MTIRRYGPGKFDTMLESYLYGMEDESIGESETFGYYALVRLENPHAVQTIIDGIEEEEGSLTADEKALLRESAGFIWSEDSQGFVSFEWYPADDAEEMENSWQELLDEWDEFGGGEFDEY